jgi:hypothetical protein
MLAEKTFREVTAPPAYGETLGIDVPTRYDETAHAVFAAVMAADSVVTPTLFGMSRRTRIFCRWLAALLVVTTLRQIPLKHRLAAEAGVGASLLVLGVYGTVSRRIFERLYLIIGGVLMLGNALMTEVKDDQEGTTK